MLSSPLPPPATYTSKLYDAKTVFGGPAQSSHAVWLSPASRNLKHPPKIFQTQACHTMLKRRDISMSLSKRFVSFNEGPDQPKPKNHSIQSATLAQSLVVFPENLLPLLPVPSSQPQPQIADLCPVCLNDSWAGERAMQKRCMTACQVNHKPTSLSFATLKLDLNNYSYLCLQAVSSTEDNGDEVT